MQKPIDYTLYLCTDRTLMHADSVEESVELAIKGGCTFVQLREKDCTAKDFYHTALQVKKVTDYYNIPFVINDRVDIALAVDADGVHIGQKDLPAAVVRKLIGKEKILGVSASSSALAMQAQQDGADYIGVGAMFSTNTKTDVNVIKPNSLQEIRKFVNIPIVAIGGIQRTTLSNLDANCIDGIAVISAVLAQEDITASAQLIKQLFLDLKHKTL